MSLSLSAYIFICVLNYDIRTSKHLVMVSIIPIELSSSDWNMATRTNVSSFRPTYCSVSEMSLVKQHLIYLHMNAIEYCFRDA